VRSRYPHRADILYQLLLVHTFTFDSARASQDLQDLYASPKSTSYTAPAQAHIYAMQAFLHSQSISDSARRAEHVHEIGRLYWNLGYYQQAYHMMQRAVKLDTNYFVGLLWALQYSIQAGDTIQAKEYLTRLERIDRENPLVKSYKTVALCQENLRRSNEHKKRSELHLTLSREYNVMNLLDEALDEAQRAIGEDPSNAEAWHHLSGLFEKKNKPLAANRALQKASLLEIHSTHGSSNSPAKK
jgi:tetratricopeptide (TPR) repeat protein